jgi:hypothetical protein
MKCMNRNACMHLCFCGTNKVESFCDASLFRDLRDNVILKHSRLTACYYFKAEIYRKSLKFITNRVVLEV